MTATTGSARHRFLRRRRPTVPERRPAGTAVAEAVGLHVRLGGRAVLAGIDLAARAGEVLALVGPNGAGKSTLLAALAADLPAASGTVRIDGRPAGAWAAPELALRRAVLPQAAELSFPFTVAEVVAMGRAPWAGTGVAGAAGAADADADADGEAVARAMAATEVSGFADRPFTALSGGERARVALARVLAQQAPLLLLDEPTAALDLRHQELVLRICRERAAAGDAVVAVLHDLGLAAAYADRIAVLEGGRIAADGPPAKVLRADLLSQVYRQPVEVLPHPQSGIPMVLPVRDADRPTVRNGHFGLTSA
ncbi:heme ABC transporter ATP-binding protein [Streptomyces sp. NPDC127106]|uniref:heme ABC transporter ATP-binding protein n=1 Tax=Streptomyces sp. NPDC127106 TaxID=3345360 RepID=UPI003630FAA4